MKVEEMMTSPVVTLSPENTVEEAYQCLQRSRISHIPVVGSDDHFIGLVSDHHLSYWMTEAYKSGGNIKNAYQRPLSDVAIRNVQTGHPLDFVEEVTVLFEEYHLRALPILSDKKVVGIITKTDLLKTFIALTGAGKPGSHLEVRVPNKPGNLARVTDVMNSDKLNIHSILVYPNADDDRFKILVFRVGTMNPLPLVHALHEEGFDVLWPKEMGTHV